jgi:hypothetical protein
MPTCNIAGEITKAAKLNDMSSASRNSFFFRRALGAI